MGEIFFPYGIFRYQINKKVSPIECERMIEHIYAGSLNIRTYMYSSGNMPGEPPSYMQTYSEELINQDSPL